MKKLNKKTLKPLAPININPLLCSLGLRVKKGSGIVYASQDMEGLEENPYDSWVRMSIEVSKSIPAKTVAFIGCGPAIEIIG